MLKFFAENPTNFEELNTSIREETAGLSEERIKTVISNVVSQ
jgi:hypothetical protein